MTKILITQKSKLMKRVGRSVVIGNQKIAVFQTNSGSIHALADYCPLTNSPILEGIVAGEYLYEPMREYKISLETGEIQAPDEGQISVFPLEITGDNIYLVV